MIITLYICKYNKVKVIIFTNIKSYKSIYIYIINTYIKKNKKKIKKKKKKKNFKNNFFYY